ncbi:hypothetical protein CBF45_03370 [Bordetella sp. J329]|nr:hypothetical protein CBF45_03370 [Bordetella sp. J329]
MPGLLQQSPFSFSSAAVAQPHALQSLWQIQLAGLSADALQEALQSRLFAYTQNQVTAAELAERLGMEARRLGYWLELLWGMGLLQREQGSDGGDLYLTHPEMDPWLNPDSPHYCGDALLFRHQTLRQAGARLHQQLTGQPAARPPLSAEEIQQNWADAARLHIGQEQRNVTTETALRLLGGWQQGRGPGRLLDLGGGPGWVAIALAQHWPQWHGVVFEYPAVAQVAQENIEQAGLAQRLKAVGGDVGQDDFGKDYDMIWCSSVLHFVQDIPALLARLHDALAPGGVLVCCHAEINREAADLAVLQYYLNLRMQGRSVLDAGHTASLLQQAGFSEVEQIGALVFPVAPVTAVIARKAG